MTFRTSATKIAATGLAASIAALAAGAGNASAAEPVGLGNAAVATTVLDAKIGDLLGLTLLKDSSFANTDDVAGPLGAVANLTSLQVSSTISALNLTRGTHRVSSPGNPSTVTSSVLDLAQAGIPSAVLSGAIEPISMTALHSPASATQTTAKITSLAALGGILDVSALTSTDKTGAGTKLSEATRNLSIDSINSLKLGDLLQLLGFDLLRLPLETVQGLINSLGIPVAALDGTNLQTLVASIGTNLDALLATSNTTVDGLLGQLTPLNAVTGALGLPPVAETAGSAVSSAIDTLRATLAALVNQIVDAIEDTVLISVKTLNLDVTTKATDAVATSVATAKGSLGGIKIGNLIEIPAVDLTATADQINGLLANVEGQLNTVLEPLGLANLIRLRLFEKATNIDTVNGYVRSVASITALSLKITPPANLSGIIANLGAGLPLLGDDTGLAALPVPEVGALLSQATNGVSSVLTNGLELNVGRVASQSLHAVPAVATATPQAPVATTNPGTLPRTGGEAAPLALGALTLGGLALAARRLNRRTQTDG